MGGHARHHRIAEVGCHSDCLVFDLHPTSPPDMAGPRRRPLEFHFAVPPGSEQHLFRGLESHLTVGGLPLPPPSGVSRTLHGCLSGAFDGDGLEE